MVFIFEWKKKCWIFKKLFIYFCICNYLFCWFYSRVVWSIGYIYRFRLLLDIGRLERILCRWFSLYCLSFWFFVEFYCFYWLCIDEFFCFILDYKYVNLLNYVSILLLLYVKMYFSGIKKGDSLFGVITAYY